MTLTRTYTRDDIAPRAKEIYERDIKHLVEPEHVGKYLVIDIETGEWDMDTDPFAASMRAAKSKPGSLRFALRIGYPATGWFRGRRPATL